MRSRCFTTLWSSLTFVHSKTVINQSSVIWIRIKLHFAEKNLFWVWIIITQIEEKQTFYWRQITFIWRYIAIYSWYTLVNIINGGAPLIHCISFFFLSNFLDSNSYILYFMEQSALVKFSQSPIIWSFHSIPFTRSLISFSLLTYRPQWFGRCCSFFWCSRKNSMRKFFSRLSHERARAATIAITYDFIQTHTHTQTAKPEAISIVEKIGISPINKKRTRNKTHATH